MNGVRQLLDDQPSDHQLFSEGGFDYTIQPDQVIGDRTFVLLHRGNRLDSASLRVMRDGTRETPSYEGSPLRDGVWLLLRFRRVVEYPLQRDWYPQVRQLIANLVSLVDDVRAGVLGKDQSLASLKPGPEAQPSLYDEYRRLRNVVLTDGVLTPAEAGGYAGTLGEIRRLATAAVQSCNYAAFDQGVRQFRGFISKGQSAVGDTVQTMKEAVSTARNLRPVAAVEFAKGLNSSAPCVSATMPFKEYTKLHVLIPER
jgi:hypothetical protein